MKRILAIGLCVILTPLISTAGTPEIHDRVFLKVDAVARLDDAPVDASTIPILPYPPKILKIDGDWVRLKTAWVRKQDVMLPKEAVEYFTERIRQNPRDASAWRTRGAAWLELLEVRDGMLYRLYEDKAEKDLAEAIRLDPKCADAYTLRAISRGGLRSKTDLDIQDCTEAIKLDPKNIEAYNLRASRWSWMDEFDKATDDYSEAIRINPTDPGSFRHRGELLKRIGDIDGYLRDCDAIFKLCQEGPSTYEDCFYVYNEVAWLRATWPDDRHRNGKLALELATKCREIRPWKEGQWYPTIDTLAAAYAEAGDFANAVKWARYSMTHGPERAAETVSLYQAKKPYRSTGEYDTIAWLKATSPKDRYRDGKKAVEMATTACELTDWKRWDYIDTLAAACAEAGDFAKAIEYEQKALAAAPATEHEHAIKTKEEATRRLELYRSNKPYRD